jgi:hypothetical protein
MILISWLFDKLGFMPKIKVDAGVVAAWPFPVEVEKVEPTVKKAEPKTKPAVKKKPAVKRASTRKAK